MQYPITVFYYLIVAEIISKIEVYPATGLYVRLKNQHYEFSANNLFGMDSAYTHYYSPT